MASPSSLLSAENFSCSICLEVFASPVTLPCGHNFCKACITTCWDGDVQYRCPMCKECFNTRPELRVNTFISELAQQVRVLCVEDELKSLQQHEVDLTLDPDTAYHKLILSQDGKQVHDGDKMKRPRRNPKRFSQFAFVLTKQSFSSGRFYFEVQVKEKTHWGLGVVSESINRKRFLAASPEYGFWIIWLHNGNEYKAFCNPRVPLSLRTKPQKVGVFVDYDEGQVSFYDVESRVHIYSFTGCTFREPIYPFLGPHLSYDGENSAPMIISPVNQRH